MWHHRYSRSSTVVADDGLVPNRHQDICSHYADQMPWSPLSSVSKPLGWCDISIKLYNFTGPLSCLFNSLSRPTTKKCSNLYITGLLCWESTTDWCISCMECQLFIKYFSFMTISWRHNEYLMNLEWQTKTHYCSRWFSYRDHFVNVPSQWETMLHCNIISHWLGASTFCECAQPMRDDVYCNIISHWLGASTKWSLLLHELWAPIRCSPNVWMSNISAICLSLSYWVMMLFWHGNAFLITSPW